MCRLNQASVLRWDFFSALHYNGLYFKQTADIDMSGVEGFYGIGAAPLKASGSSTYYFGGNYDGGGFRIKNLKINGVTFDANGKVEAAGANKSRNYVGLFGYLVKGASVSNVILDKSCSVTGYQYVGGIVGYCDAGNKVENCVNEADVTGYYYYVGGVVGRAYKTSATTPDTEIINCHNTGTVRSNGHYAGGITSYITYGKIIGCSNYGDVTAGAFHISQTAGKQSYSGGIAGYASGTEITDCVNGGTISASMDDLGGIVGSSSSKTGVDNGIVTRCINYGSILGANQGVRGQILGANGSAGTSIYLCSNCLYDSQLMPQTTVGAGSGSAINWGFVPKTTAELTSGTLPEGYSASMWAFNSGFYPMLKSFQTEAAKQRAATYVSLPAGVTGATFTGQAIVSKAQNGITVKAKGTSTWLTGSGASITAAKSAEFVTDTIVITNGDYSRMVPVCQIQIPFGGKGTKENPYQIAKAEDLKALAALVNKQSYSTSFVGEHFKFTADIDMKADTAFHGIGTLPITNAYKYVYFGGNIDGDGHKVSNLEIVNISFNTTTGGPLSGSGKSYSHTGFIGTLVGGCEVKNLTLDETCNISGYQRIGGLVGFLNLGCKVTNCHVAGTVKAYYSESGGIVGRAPGQAVGDIITTISNCSFTGKMFAQRDVVGGIAGYTSGEIINCVNTGYVRSEVMAGTAGSASAYKNVGGIVGQNYGILKGCANYGNVYGQQYIGGIAGSCNSTYDGGLFSNCLNTGVVTNLDPKTVSRGNIFGNVASTTAKFEIKDCYYDGQLTTTKAVTDTTYTGANATATAALTSGEVIKGLEDYFVFAKGYYPVPKVFADRADIKAAAATFFVLPEGETIAEISSNGIINSVMPLTASLEKTDVFEVKDNQLIPLKVTEPTTDKLTLTNGTFSIFYPVTNSGKASGIADNIADEEVMTTEYYNLQGVKVLTPANGQVVIKVETTTSGTRRISKVLAR